uniref:NADH dehydrogenase subunit 2 n=1 Tax=Nowellia curvifolia TaxID=280839 RepID=A0A6C0SL42_9MARC|nr:NADH dehydrogenase subunit 2 [Nowellia curvifolia]QIA60588.1 NADH dehydrogenase subunit 2 [Nowellia curvifolia]UQM88599.1 NADH dehydrogenase subunit 2 [Nowellia curvifolia]
MFEHDFLALFPEIFLINATIILLIYGVVFSTSKKYDYPPLVRNVGWLGLLSVLITILLVAVGSPLAVANLVYNNLIIDNFTYFCQIFLLLSTVSTIVMCLDYSKQESSNAFESIVLILFSTCSMLFMISAYDLIAMYLAIELQSLCFYVIAASKRDSEFSAEAGLKYFILGAFSSGILLFGCSTIYGFTGVTNFEELAKIFTGYEITLFGAQSSGIFMGILFIAVGFLSKITAVPFHMWAPDVYEGSPTTVTAFFSIAPKISILANMLRVFIYSFYDPTWQQLFFFCSIASMILGALAAMAQNKVKRLLAYSSIGHVGYLLIGFSCGTIEGIQSLLIGTFIYVLMTVNAFAMVLALRQNRFKYIADLGALAKTNPILAITPSITMFPYAGIPPLAGFCSKFYLFFAALGCGAYLLALIGVVTSVMSCFYYIRFVKIMYFDTPETWILYKPMDREKSLLLAITVFFITFFFLYPSPLFLVTHQMALCLCL